MEGIIGRIRFWYFSSTTVKKIFVVFLIFLFPLILFSGIFFLQQLIKKPSIKTKAEKSVPTGKTWEILLVYNGVEKKLSAKKISLLSKTITQDNRSAKFSPYELKIINSKNSVLFTTKIQITEELIYNIIANPDSSASSSLIPSQPKELNTLMYIPDYGEDVIVKIFREDVLFLEIPLPKKTALRFAPNVFAAQTSSGTCGALIAVFISDRYTDFTRFHADVDRIKAVYVSTPPYAAVASMFDFKIIDNTEPLGCENGILTCVNNPRIQQIGYAKYPNASKFIVLANQPIQNPYDGSVLGVTTGIGGSTEVFSNASDGIHANLVPRVAAHEFLGHAVGLLYDRYVLVGNALGNPRSNCSSNPSGNAFWAQAGVSNGYLGCYAQNLYAPGPLSCSTSNPDLVSGGTPASIMSAAGCGGPNFDAVETYWIQQNVLPDYQACSGITPTPTNSQTPAPSITQTVTPSNAPTSVPPSNPTSTISPSAGPTSSPVSPGGPTPTEEVAYSCFEKISGNPPVGTIKIGKLYCCPANDSACHP